MEERALSKEFFIKIDRSFISIVAKWMKNAKDVDSQGAWSKTTINYLTILDETFNKMPRIACLSLKLLGILTRPHSCFMHFT